MKKVCFNSRKQKSQISSTTVTNVCFSITFQSNKETLHMPRWKAIWKNKNFSAHLQALNKILNREVMVEEDANQHLYHPTAELEWELRVQNELWKTNNDIRRTYGIKLLTLTCITNRNGYLPCQKQRLNAEYMRENERPQCRAMMTPSGEACAG